MNAPTTNTGNKARTPRLGAVLALLLGIMASVPIFAGPGMVLTRAGGDSPFLLLRVQQLTTNLRAGVFPARWLPNGAHGLGYPFFDFYASLPYYVAAILHWAGANLVLSIQITQLLGFVAACQRLLPQRCSPRLSIPSHRITWPTFMCEATRCPSSQPWHCTQSSCSASRDCAHA